MICLGDISLWFRKIEMTQAVQGNLSERHEPFIVSTMAADGLVT